MSASVSFYCQKCLAPNPLSADFCVRCGTRLMIVVEPAAAKYQGSSDASLSIDEHLLERISSAENKISRLTERLERSLDLLLRQAQNTYFDRSLMKALIDLLEEDGIVETPRLEKLWDERCKRDAADQDATLQRSVVLNAILTAFTGQDNEEFERLVSDGFSLIEKEKFAKGIKLLTSAAELASTNVPLSIFLGEQYFRLENTKLARHYLSKANEADPQNVHVILLLGLTCADDGEPELAKTLLTDAAQRGGSSFAAHYGLGWLFAAEKKWTLALKEFQQALDSKPSPEAHYALAEFYYKQQRYALALGHLQKSVEMDPSYQEALYMMASIHHRKGDLDLAEEALLKAKKAGGKAESSRRGTSSRPVGNSKPKLMAGNKRLVAAVRADALNGFNRSAS